MRCHIHQCIRGILPLIIPIPGCGWHIEQLSRPPRLVGVDLLHNFFNGDQHWLLTTHYLEKASQHKQLMLFTILIFLDTIVQNNLSAIIPSCLYTRQLRTTQYRLGPGALHATPLNPRPEQGATGRTMPIPFTPGVSLGLSGSPIVNGSNNISLRELFWLYLEALETASVVREGSLLIFYQMINFLYSARLIIGPDRTLYKELIIGAPNSEKWRSLLLLLFKLCFRYLEFI